MLKASCNLFLILLLFSCGHKKSVHVDEDIAPYIKSFEELYNIKVNLSVTFVKQTSSVIGACFSYSNKDLNKIEIDPDFWDLSNSDEKEQLIFHELGHCVLSRDHREDVILTNDNVNIAASIMYPYLLNYISYSNYRDYYLKELVNPDISFY